MDSHNHWKFKSLRREYRREFEHSDREGWAGEGKFWALNNLIAEADNSMLDISHEPKKNSIAADIDLSQNEFEVFLDIIINRCRLVIYDGICLTTKRVQLVFDTVQNTRERERNKKKNYRKTSKNPIGEKYYPSTTRNKNVPEGQSNVPTGQQTSPHENTGTLIQSKVKESKVNTEGTSYPRDPNSSNSNHGEEKNGRNVIGITGGVNAGDLAGKIKRRRAAPKNFSSLGSELEVKMRDRWFKWFQERNHGTPPNYDGSHGNHIKKISKYFLGIGRTKDFLEEKMIYDFAFDEFSLILSRWEELKIDPYLYASVDIKQISSNLNKIINTFNNGRAINKSGNSKQGLGTSDARVNALRNW